MSKPAKSRRLPLDDSRWWSLGETLTYCRSQPLFSLEDLAAAVNQEQVRSKLEYPDRSTRPAKRIVLLLTSEFFQREAAIIPFWSGLALQARTKKAVQMRPYALYFWEPDIKKFWPDRPVRNSPSNTTAALPARPSNRGAKAKYNWDVIVAEVVRRVHEVGRPSAGDILKWCGEHLDKVPEEDTLKRKLSVWLSRLPR
jgi:hypothetical protein